MRLQRLSQGIKNFVLDAAYRRQCINNYTPTRESFSMKRIILLTAGAYFGGTVYFLSNNSEAFSIKMDISRNTYNVVEDDMLQPFSEFTTFNEFFTRRVKQRVINPDENILLSPADSKVLTIAEVTGDSNILVKGINYKLGEFLTGRREVVLEDELFKTLKLKDQANKIYQVIFYLNPGDYHRYHSPTEVLVKRSNHILGYLAPVKESYIATHERVYEGNERVAVFGQWKHGQLTQVYVGATNVGSMTLEFDNSLSTNQSISMNMKDFKKTRFREYGKQSDEEKVSKTAEHRPDLQEFGIEELQAINEINRQGSLSSIYLQQENGILVPKGAEMGRFNLGSTVVMFIEVASTPEWLIKEGDKVRFGQPFLRATSNPPAAALK